MHGFRDALDFSGLKDLVFNDFPFTSCNRRLGDQNVWGLDHGLAAVDWILRFPTSRIHHLDSFHSDHKPILLISEFESKRFYRKGRPFRFEAMWLKDKTCKGVINDSGAPLIYHLCDSCLQSCLLAKTISKYGIETYLAM